MTLKFQAMKAMPSQGKASTGMHPDTQAIITRLSQTKDPVFAVSGFASPTAAKRRLDAIRRAQKRGQVKFKEGSRQGANLFFKLR